MYIESAKRIYHEFKATDFKKLTSGFITNYDKVFSSIEQRFNFEELRLSHFADIKVTADKYLPFFKKELEKFLQLSEVTYYIRNIPHRTLLLFMWIWENRLGLSEQELIIFSDSLFLGTIGYKLIDVNSDNQNTKSELSLVGFYSIKLAERLLSEVLGFTNTLEIIEKYFSMYVEAELLEKKNRWRACPFSWEEIDKIGNKSAPLYIVHESLFKFAEYDSHKIRDLVNALSNVFTVIQLIDDLADAKQDLANGYETLVMSGYYNQFGLENEVTDEKINKILSQERLKLVYKTGQELFDNSRKIFKKYDEFILQFNTEWWNFNFTTLFRLS